MDRWHASAVFFVSDAESSLRFYTEKLAFSLEWNYKQEGRTTVFSVSLHGFQLILNQIESSTADRVGHGRVFVGLKEGEESEALRKHIEENQIETSVTWWGAPTRVILDLDGNELYFWPSLESGAEGGDPQ